MNAARLLGILAFLAFGCTDDAATRSTLQKAGFSDVETLGYDHWACGEGDLTKTKFRAKNPKGDVVEGVVCCGNGCAKACTVRF